MSNVTKIKKFDIANGEGIRTSIFFSGCEFHCKGCFNSEAWDFKSGKPFDLRTYLEEIKPTINEHVAGISILGGEPLHPNNIYDVYTLILWFKMDFPDKNIWLWSGYTYEELMDIIEQREIPFETFCLQAILNNISVLVDGQFIEEQRDLTLKWRGSQNQRVIDIKKTLISDKVILYG